MHIDSNGIKPIYLQIADWLENEIIGSVVVDGSKIHWTNEKFPIFNCRFQKA